MGPSSLFIKHLFPSSMLGSKQVPPESQETPFDLLRGRAFALTCMRQVKGKAGRVVICGGLSRVLTLFFRRGFI